MKKKTLLALLLAAPSLAFAASSELVVNGSFEDNAVIPGQYSIFNGAQVPGWTALNEIELRNNNVGTAQSGVNFAELDANHNNSMSQVLDTESGASYTLSFYYSNRTGTKVSTDGLSFDVGSGPVILPALSANDTGDNLWSLFTTQFTATSAKTTLTFSSLGTNDSYGSSIDNVSVTPVPEPDTYALMLAGLVVIGCVARRRAAQS